MGNLEFYYEQHISVTLGHQQQQAAVGGTTEAN